MNLSSWTRGVSALLGIALAAPCWAGEQPTLSTARGPVRTLQAATDAKLATADTSKAVRFAQATGGSVGESKPFFKYTKGVLVAVLMVGGVTWAIVSRSQDAVHSPAR